jgi:mannan endo-1,4-beta-mannosidase
MTIHIWSKNWGWFVDGKMSDGFPNIVKETEKYVAENVAVAKKLDKPLVIEEFGLPRDGQSFDPRSGTGFRDKYYKMILAYIGNQSDDNAFIAGDSFWAFGGTARPIRGQTFWKPGDELTGDPPMEEQGLNSVIDSDRSTLQIIRSANRSIRHPRH